MTFDQWFNDEDWWKKESRREEFEAIWVTMEDLDIPNHFIIEIFETIIAGCIDDFGAQSTTAP